MPGYTLSLDFPVRDSLMPFLDTLDEMVMKREGRLYLAKDARMSAQTFEAMYPQVKQWRAAKRSIDPNNHFASSLSRRLAMDPA
jgi:FAD/FMN-containing dehydrogenase